MQAFSGMSKDKTEKATELAEDKRGQVTVVCTPSGGAQTVRLQLDENWNESISDETLIKAIEQEQ